MDDPAAKLFLNNEWKQSLSFYISVDVAINITLIFDNLRLFIHLSRTGCIFLFLCFMLALDLSLKEIVPSEIYYISGRTVTPETEAQEVPIGVLPNIAFVSNIAFV